ncbi:Serine/threonine-protein phosphatase 7 long form homolog [Linum perenne]
MTHTCRNSKKIVDYDPRFESILSDIGLDSLRDALKLTPDLELITALVERWRPETNTFHLYGGEATITLEDVHFITGLSVDGLPVTSPRLILVMWMSFVLTLRASYCIFADRSGAYAHLFMLPLLEDIDRVGEYAWGAAALSWLYQELGLTAFRIDSGTTTEHIGDIGGWLALLQVWALERFPSIARRVHSKRKKSPKGRTIPRLPQ